jgi:hypothetical protein
VGGIEHLEQTDAARRRLATPETDYVVNEDRTMGSPTPEVEQRVGGPFAAPRRKLGAD